MYLFYLMLFVVLLVAEAVTVNFVTIWISLASLITCFFACFFPDMYLAQVAVLVITSIILIMLTKPFAEKIKAKKTSTNSDSLIGEIAVVTEDINNIESVGFVKVKGQIWSARSSNGRKIEKNKKIKIERIEGVKLIVSQIEEVTL